MKIAIRILGLALVVTAGSDVFATEPQLAQAVETKRDSGRYGVAATCSTNGDWVTCEVSVRDLVYETLLLPPRGLKATLNGSLGDGVQVQTHPAQGQPGQIGISVSAPHAKAMPMLAKVTVQVTEGDHIVQDYSLSFPVSRNDSQPRGR